MTLDDAASPWLSIVTVVKDEPEGLERTAESITRQQAFAEPDPGFEWVIIDSSSSTIEASRLIAKYPNVASHYVWTPPAGVYPAMNAGQRMLQVIA